LLGLQAFAHFSRISVMKAAFIHWPLCPGDRTEDYQLFYFSTERVSYEEQRTERQCAGVRDCEHRARVRVGQSPLLYEKPGSRDGGGRGVGGLGRQREQGEGCDRQRAEAGSDGAAPDGGVAALLPTTASAQTVRGLQGH